MVAAPWTFVAAQPAVSELPSIRVEVSGASDARAQQLATTARRTLLLLSDWLGPYPDRELTIVDASRQDAGAATAAVELHWWELERDPATERALIAAIATNYWIAALSEPPDRRWFTDAIVRYTALRAIDVILEGRQHWTERYFGGVVPFALRSLPLSPYGGETRGHIPHFDAEIRLSPGGDRPRVARATAALFTLDRFIGSPALQAGLREYRATARDTGYSPAHLAAVLSRQRGSDLAWFFNEALRPDATFDYGVEQFSSEPAGGRFHVRVGLRRFGNAVFGEDDGSGAGAALPVVVTLADGTELLERWPGARASLALEYDTVSPASRAAVDPDAMLLLDDNRANNTRLLTTVPATSVALRAAASWMIWLEGLMLTCVGLV
jgi:hypothetical protein